MTHSAEAWSKAKQDAEHAAKPITELKSEQAVQIMRLFEAFLF